MNARFNDEGTLAHDSLLAGGFPRVERKVTIASGAGALERGSVLADDGAGKLVLVNSNSATAATQDPLHVLAHDVDAAAADAEAIVYDTGEFNDAALTLGGTDDADTHRAALRALGIHLHTNTGA